LISADDIDHTGIKVLVAVNSPADGYLTGTLQKAAIIRLPRGIDEARQARHTTTNLRPAAPGLTMWPHRGQTDFQVSAA